MWLLIRYFSYKKSPVVTSFLGREGGWASKKSKMGKEVPIKEINTPPPSLSSLMTLLFAATRYWNMIQAERIKKSR